MSGKPDFGREREQIERAAPLSNEAGQIGTAKSGTTVAKLGDGVHDAAKRDLNSA
jgi:hypothetical protein